MDNQVDETETTKPRKNKNVRVTEGEGDFPHHESRVGERYNAIVPDFDAGIAEETRNKGEDQLTSEKTYIPTDIDESIITDFLTTARSFSGRNDDFLLQMLYEHNYDTNSTIRCLKKCCQNYCDSLFQRAKSPFNCSCSCHTFPLYRQNMYRSYFKYSWGLKQLEKLNIDMSKVDRLLSQENEPTEETCFICGDGGDLILCDGGCNRAYHIECLNLTEVPKEEKWICPYCLKKQEKTQPAPKKQKTTSHSTSTKRSKSSKATPRTAAEEKKIQAYVEKQLDLSKAYNHLPSPSGNVPKFNTNGDYNSNELLTDKIYIRSKRGSSSSSEAPRLHCPIKGCDYISVNRTSLMSHARSYHPNEYGLIAKSIGCNFSYRLPSGLIEYHSFTYKCPIPGCTARYDHFASFDRHITHVHGASGVSDFDVKDYIDKEIVRQGKKEDLFKVYKRKLELAAEGKLTKTKKRKPRKRYERYDYNDEDY